MKLPAQPLQGSRIRLEHLDQSHAQGLFNRGREADDWRYMPRACFVDLADTRHWVDEAMAQADQYPFAIVEVAKGKVVGSTRYLNIRPEHASLEIGWTWLGQDWQGTGVNTEAKYLLLSHAFEVMGCRRVEFKADARNLRSQRALEGIGATREGVLRQHMIVQGDFSRDSVYFSVLDNEWPDVGRRLQQKLQATAR
ncbi:GNAT family N-acetyltransferase [Parahalioglobus pacificus]|uniref:N-acetyltransferase n=1 Tax=Parahalioglobus pacificus TaxID=930806 RepID=A0A918XI07_9GAMM|nr:GNAT family protein [Halioglobus pacificus]NQY03173.1 GNAT family N-acetyltransferase [Halieaceae bacterium]GHD32622.1 N-acetyltransferase [Halioglobus pacificus]